MEKLGFEEELAIRCQQNPDNTPFDIARSYMKDYYDFSDSEKFKFKGPKFVKAIKSIFCLMKTTIPGSHPVGLTKNFVNDEAMRTRWNTFLERNHLFCPKDLGDRVLTYRHNL